MLDTDKLREWQRKVEQEDRAYRDEQRQKDIEYRDRQEKEEREWRQKQEATSRHQFNLQLWLLGIGVILIQVLSQILIALIQAKMAK